MQGNGVPIGLAVHAQVGALGQRAAQHTVGVLVDVALSQLCGCAKHTGMPVARDSAWWCATSRPMLYAMLWRMGASNRLSTRPKRCAVCSAMAFCSATDTVTQVLRPPVPICDWFLAC